MSATELRRTTEEVARLGAETFATLVRPKLLPEDDGKFVAVDVETGDYEIDDDDYLAISRLQARNPRAEVWLECAGQATAYKMRRGR